MAKEETEEKKAKSSDKIDKILDKMQAFADCLEKQKQLEQRIGAEVSALDGRIDKIVNAIAHSKSVKGL